MAGRTTLGLAVAAACVLTLACGAAVAASDGGTAAAGGDGPVAAGGNGTAANGTAANESADAPPDPDEDVLGWEDGYWHEEAIDVDQSDGLSERERAALVARTKARVEEIRGLEFAGNVTVTVASRESLSAGSDGANQSADAPEPDRQTTDRVVYLNQLYEALFLVNETTDATGVLAQGRAEATAAYYTPAEDELVVVTDPDRPVVDEGVLAHELVHALQNQYLDGDTWFVGLDTIDEYLAYLGLSEGDAEYVRAVYDGRCGVTWSCTTTPDDRTTDEADGSDDGDEDGASGVVRGVSTYTFQPYADGAAFVAELHERGGWAAVNGAYGDPPATTAAVIDPESYPREQPPAVDAPTAPADDWRVIATDRVGEAGVYAMLHAQAAERGVGDLDPRTHHEPEAGAFDRLNYTARASAGWTNDSLVVVRNGTRAGYAWATRWETVADAREFELAYRRILRSYDAERRGDGVWVVNDDGFADAFRVERDGRGVTITNAPTVDALDAVNPRTNATAGGNESAESTVSPRRHSQSM
jgi:hypothetical protein